MRSVKKAEEDKRREVESQKTELEGKQAAVENS